MFLNTHDMSMLPEVIEGDILSRDQVLHDFLARSNATVALLIDKGGFIITQCGQAQQFDLTTLAALASAAYLASQTIAKLMREKNFNSVYQQGENLSLLITDVAPNYLLITIFKTCLSVEVVKCLAAAATRQINSQMKATHKYARQASMGMSSLNPETANVAFHKQS
jgi:predicted regulator of Ras-like GTPase activity (Roadblock/LC7/MglB family)